MNTPDPLLWNVLLLLLSVALLALPFWPTWREWRHPQDAAAGAAGLADTEPVLSDRLQLAPGATFQNLHAAQLLLGCGPMPAPIALPALQRWHPPPGAKPWGVHGWHIGHPLDIGTAQFVPCALVVRGRLSVQGPCLIDGDIKARDGLRLGAGTQVRGNLFSEGDLWLEAGCSVRGLVVTEGRLHLGPGVVIGSPNAPVSVCADVIDVHGPVMVHGSVQARLIGTVACVNQAPAAAPVPQPPFPPAPERDRMTDYLACLGTRPEIIKLAPVYRALRARGHRVHVSHTGQHTDMADPLYAFFGMAPDARLRLQRQVPRLPHLTAELLAGMDEQMQALAPDVVLVQGDTSTALAGALVAAYQNVPVAHVEAGLRTGTHDPFPEEMNRSLIGRLARWHFAPTPQARVNLLREGVDSGQIHDVGNTVIDAAQWARTRMVDSAQAWMPPDLQRFLHDRAHPALLLVTAHRRENWGLPMQRIAAAVGGLLQLHPQLTVAWLLHPNPQVCADVHTGLAGLPADVRPRLCLTQALQYPALIGLLERCSFTLTDSGGIQEEASALQKPVLILRESTERQELVDAGGARLVGTMAHRIIDEASELLRDPLLRASMQLTASPFGDGHAAQRIADVLCQQSPSLTHCERLAA